MKHIALLFLLVFCWMFGYSQRWKKYRYDVSVGLGTTQFMGDLGGGPEEAAHFLGLRDVDFAATRPVLGVNLRYKIWEIFAVKGGLYTGIFSADDALSQNIERQYRNLHFRSFFVEPSMQFEFSFLKENVASRYALAQGGLLYLTNMYLFVGVGGVYFNPKAKSDDGKWTALQPLMTEGEEYSKFAITMPLGIGFRFSLNKLMSVGIEVGARYTSSDYMDDAHDRYYVYPEDNPAYEFTDRHLDFETGELATEKYETGQKYRGNPRYNDAYVFILLNMSYKLRVSGRGLPKFR